MPMGLKRYQDNRDLHFVTFSCYHRRPLLQSKCSAILFLWALEQARVKYGFCICGYVIMPEHVHLLVSEPERNSLATSLKAVKQSVARRLAPAGGHFWQARYYDFNVRTAAKRIEKLKYIHRNPVRRGLVAKPENWQWSSFHHYLTGEQGIVEVESPWTTWERASAGNRVKLKMVPAEKTRSSFA